MISQWQTYTRSISPEPSERTRFWAWWWCEECGERSDDGAGRVWCLPPVHRHEGESTRLDNGMGLSNHSICFSFPFSLFLGHRFSHTHAKLCTYFILLQTICTLFRSCLASYFLLFIHLRSEQSTGMSNTSMFCLQGLGTDESVVSEVLASRSNAQLRRIRQRFSQGEFKFPIDSCAVNVCDSVLVHAEILTFNQWCYNKAISPFKSLHTHSFSLRCSWFHSKYFRKIGQADNIAFCMHMSSCIRDFVKKAMAPGLEVLRG